MTEYRRAADPTLFRQQTAEREQQRADLIEEWRIADRETAQARAESLAGFDRAAHHHRAVFRAAGGVLDDEQDDATPGA
jgi:hypothetical protein